VKVSEDNLGKLLSKALTSLLMVMGQGAPST